jgi:hypothetical protein
LLQPNQQKSPSYDCFPLLSHYKSTETFILISFFRFPKQIHTTWISDFYACGQFCQGWEAHTSSDMQSEGRLRRMGAGAVPQPCCAC